LDKGEVHIKSGYIEGEEFYVIKIASGFYGNPSIGLPSGSLFILTLGLSLALGLSLPGLSDFSHLGVVARFTEEGGSSPRTLGLLERGKGRRLA